MDGPTVCRTSPPARMSNVRREPCARWWMVGLSVSRQRLPSGDPPVAMFGAPKVQCVRWWMDGLNVFNSRWPKGSLLARTCSVPRGPRVGSEMGGPTVCRTSPPVMISNVRRERSVRQWMDGHSVSKSRPLSGDPPVVMFGAPRGWCVRWWMVGLNVCNPRWSQGSLLARTCSVPKGRRVG